LTILSAPCRYTAIGMVTMPINMIRSRSRSSKKERQDADEEIGMATGQRTLLLDKCDTDAHPYQSVDHFYVP
jgi:hypothetical protein